MEEEEDEEEKEEEIKLTCKYDLHNQLLYLWS